MKKRVVAAACEAKLFQCVIYGSTGDKKVIAVYMSGDDVFFADSVKDLFSQGKVAPDWLKKSLKKWGEETADGTAWLDFTGQKLTPRPAAVSETAKDAPVIAAPANVDVATFEEVSAGSGAESAIRQSKG